MAAARMEGLSAGLCRAIEPITYEQLPPEVIASSKRLIVDAIGLIGGAASAPGIAQLNARLSRWETDGCATGLLGKRGYSPPTAALANGAAAHALDFDDLHDAARVHTSAVVLPTLLATAEDMAHNGAGKVSGRQFLLAMSIGAELHARLGLACYNSLGKGWHPTMVFGSLAGAVAAGKLLGLDAQRLAHALGMAFHQASGSAQSMRDGAISKRLGAGFAARNAVLAAFLAKDGLTSTHRTLEGDAGLFSLYERDEVRPEPLVAAWGEAWQVPLYSLKPFPGCRCNHTLIALGIGMHGDGVRPADVVGAVVRLGKVNWLSVGGAYDASRNSVVHAQFNAAYSFARALADGRVDLRTYEPAAVGDPAIARLAAKVSVIDDPGIDPQAIAPARVEVKLADGRTIAASSDTMPGSPEEPMSETASQAKFRACLEQLPSATSARADRLLEILGRMEECESISDVIAAFPR